MIKTSNRTWHPTEDELWDTYKNLRSYEKLEVWYGIVDNDCQIKRMKIVIPSGLTYLREFNNAEDVQTSYLMLLMISLSLLKIILMLKE